MDELKKLLAEATPLPWYFHDLRAQKEWEGEQSYSISVGLSFVDDARYYPSAPSFTDAALICAAVNALPELLALREEVGRLRAALTFIVKQVENTPVNFDGSHTAWISSGAVYGARAALNQEPTFPEIEPHEVTFGTPKDKNNE